MTIKYCKRIVHFFLKILKIYGSISKFQNHTKKNRIKQLYLAMRKKNKSLRICEREKVAVFEKSWTKRAIDPLS